LAVNEKKTVIVPDVKLLKPVLHENTNIFFETSRTESCAAIPIFISQSDDLGETASKELWGVLLLESHKSNPLTLSLRYNFDGLSNTIANIISSQIDKTTLSRTKRALADFVPENAITTIINGNHETENDQGYLVLVDLKGSTTLALRHGSNYWTKAMNEVSPKLEKICEQKGFKLQLLIWDAFFITLSTDKQTKKKVSKIVELIEELKQEIQLLYTNRFGFSDHDQKARFCFTYGDISRGLASGKTKSWTITGSEMATISKFEDYCKRLNGITFCDESIDEKTLDTKFRITEHKIPSSNRSIYIHQSDWYLKVLKKMKAA